MCSASRAETRDQGFVSLCANPASSVAAVALSTRPSWESTQEYTSKKSSRSQFACGPNGLCATQVHGASFLFGRRTGSLPGVLVLMRTPTSTRPRWSEYLVTTRPPGTTADGQHGSAALCSKQSRSSVEPPSRPCPQPRPPLIEMLEARTWTLNVPDHVRPHVRPTELKGSAAAFLSAVGILSASDQLRGGTVLHNVLLYVKKEFDRHWGTDGDRETNRDRQRQSKNTDRSKGRQSERQTDGRTHGQREKHTHTHTHTHMQTSKQTRKRKQTNKQTNNQRTHKTMIFMTPGICF